MNSKLEVKLNLRKLDGTYRMFSDASELVDFASNDYLGFSSLNESGSVCSFGSTGSRLISGNSKEAMECEVFIADFFESPKALVFNSGYDANLGFFSSIPQKGDLILYDTDIHASIRDGVRLSFANSHSFKHNSLEDLEKKLKLNGDVKFVAIESLYSMGGDMAPIVPILELCNKYKAKLIVDEAHAAGIFGSNGKGICEALSIQKEVYARIITFGKAFGSHGAAILSDDLTIDYLVNFARSFIYTTALPPDQYARIKTQIQRAILIDERNKLMSNILYFRKEYSNTYPIISEINSPIQFIRLGDVEKTFELVKQLKAAGLFVKGVVSPTVKKGEEGIRICIHSFNTKEEIDLLLKQFK